MKDLVFICLDCAGLHSVALGENCLHQTLSSKVFLQHKLKRLSTFVHPVVEGVVPVLDLQVLLRYYAMMCPDGIDDGNNDPKGYDKMVVHAAIQLYPACVNFICEFYPRSVMCTTILRLTGWNKLDGETSASKSSPCSSRACFVPRSLQSPATLHS